LKKNDSTTEGGMGTNSSRNIRRSERLGADEEQKVGEKQGSEERAIAAPRESRVVLVPLNLLRRTYVGDLGGSRASTLHQRGTTQTSGGRDKKRSDGSITRCERAIFGEEKGPKNN